MALDPWKYTEKGMLELENITVKAQIGEHIVEGGQAAAVSTDL